MIYGYTRLSTGAQDLSMRFARKQKLTQHQQREFAALIASGEPPFGLARSFNVHQSTLPELSA
jgi:hypothetical protein